MKLYVLKNGQVLGPFTDAEVRGQLAAGTIAPSDSFAVEGDSAWKSLGQLPLAAPPAPSVPAVPPPVNPARVYRADPHALPPSATGATSSLAIAALVAGILSLFCGISSIIAVILGHMALGEIRRNPALRGREMALAGMIIGYGVLALSLLVIIAMVFFGAFASQMNHFAPFNNVPGH